MSELITDYEQAETRLSQVLEVYRQGPLATLETYAFYGLDNTEGAAGKREDQKQAFLSGTIVNPKLTYPVLENPLTSDKLAGLERDVLELMRDSTDLAHDEDREAALYDILRIRRLEVGMLEVSRTTINPDLGVAEKAKLAELFNLANDEVHGRLESARFNGLMLGIQRQALELLAIDAPAEVKEAAHYYLAHTNDVQFTDDLVLPIEADSNTTQQLQQMVQEKFSDLIACVPEKDGNETFSIEEVAEIFRRAHEVRNTGWLVRIQEGQKNVDTRQSEKATVVGSKRKYPTRDKLIGLLIHENGVHVEQRQRGDATGDPLLSGTGLDRSLDAEEGIAKLLEQAITGEELEPGVQYYTTLGLARGLDGKAVRDFRRVYELEWRRRVMNEYIAKSAIDPTRVESLKSFAYNTCERIFRGTPCDIPGMVYTKDQAYFMGTQKMRKVMQGIFSLSPELREAEFDRLFAAKYDPTNVLHRRLVERTFLKASRSTASSAA